MFRTIYKALHYTFVLLSCKFSTFFCRILLKLNGVEMGDNIKSMKAIPDFVISFKSKNVHFGNNVVFNNYGDQSWYCKCKIMVRENASLTIGNNVGFNGVLLYSSNSITIGNYVKIGGGTRIYDTDHHSLDYEKRRKSVTDIGKSLPIKIEDDVFIGTGCYIGKGVTIGARSIIAAGSIVVKSIPADCIAGGNPCKVIKYISDK